MNRFLTLLVITTLINGCVSGSNEKVVRKNKKAKTKEIVGFENGERNGRYSFSYKGRKQIDGYYKDDKRDGKWTFTPNKELKIVGLYSNDKKLDYWYYYKNDTLASKIYYDSQRQIDTIFCYYSNGICSREVVKYVDQNKNDIIEYHPNSVAKQKYTEVNDKKVGICTRYDENGHMLLKLDYRNGIPFDLMYSEKSNLFIDNYSGDLKEGNGNLIVEVTNERNEKDKFIKNIVLNYKDSQLDGDYKRYHSNGKLRCQGTISEGYLIGNWVIYSEYGSVLLEKSFTEEDKRDNFANVVVHTFHDDVNESFIMSSFPAERFSNFNFYVGELIRHTEYGQINKLREKVYVNIIISETGEVINSRITKDGIEWTDFEDIEELNLIPLWIPGFMKGIPIETQYNIPILIL